MLFLDFFPPQIHLKINKFFPTSYDRLGLKIRGFLISSPTILLFFSDRNNRAK